jgi:hypothetical protein
MRVAVSADKVLEDEALRFLTVAAIFDLNPALEKGVDRLRALAQRQLDAGKSELAQRLDAFFADGYRRGSSSAPTGITKHPDWAKRLIENSRQAADGRLQDLVLGYPTFLMVVGAYGEDDPKLWQGMQRLAKFAELDKSEKGYALAKRMISTFEINPPPPHLAYLTFDLQAVVRRWEVTRR